MRKYCNEEIKKDMAIYSSILPWRGLKDRGAWQPAVYGVRSRTLLSD